MRSESTLCTIHKATATGEVITGDAVPLTATVCAATSTTLFFRKVTIDGIHMYEGNAFAINEANQVATVQATTYGQPPYILDENLEVLIEPLPGKDTENLVGNQCYVLCQDGEPYAITRQMSLFHNLMADSDFRESLLSGGLSPLAASAAP